MRSNLRPKLVKIRGRIIMKTMAVPMAWKSDPNPKYVLKVY